MDESILEEFGWEKAEFHKKFLKLGLGFYSFALNAQLK